MNHFSDESLLAMIKQGNHHAFSTLYERYWRKLFVIASNKLKDSATAEELTQDIFADLWGRRSIIEIKGNVQSYLAVAIKYKVIDVMARENLRRRYSESQIHQERLWDDSTQQWLSYEELRIQLEKLVDSLPEKCRIVYKMRENGHSQKEIAAALRISENTVENHLSKAYRRIREQFKYVLSTVKSYFLCVQP